MKRPCVTSCQVACLAASLFAAQGACAQGSEPVRATVEAVGSSGELSAGLPDASALILRGTWEFGGSNVVHAEVLQENKFGSRGGLGNVGFVKELSPDWFVAGSLALGHGGPNWANARVDVEVSTKWTEARNIVTRAALYQAQFDGDRSDRGIRLTFVDYLPNAVVLEAGIILNVSEPGRVHSQMPFVSATVGTQGAQYVSMRFSSGTEAYQAIGVDQQLVDFRSRSLGISWRRWLNPQGGFVLQAEHYSNPTYQRNTLGVGLFQQW